MTKQDAPVAFHPSTQRLRFLTPPDELLVSDAVAALYQKTIPFKRDEKVNRAIRRSLLSLNAPFTTKPDKRRIFGIIGSSGAGKSTSVAFNLARHKKLQPYKDEDGVLVRPLLIFDAPMPCTPKLLALEGLSHLGVHESENVFEHVAWIKFRKALKKFKIKFVVIDEAQNAIESANAREIGVIADGFKQLTQQRDWPMSVLLAGVPPLGAFMKRPQIKTRSTFVHFDPVVPQRDIEMLKDILRIVVTEHAGLKYELLSEEQKDDPNFDPDEFYLRLSHACSDNLGTIVQTVREAVELVLYDGRTVVTLQDFIEAYDASSGCVPEENIFEVENWRLVDPTTSPMRAEDREWEAERDKQKGKKRKGPDELFEEKFGLVETAEASTKPKKAARRGDQST